MPKIVSIVSSHDSRAEVLMLNAGPNGGAFHTNQTGEGVDSAWANWKTLSPASPSLAMAVSALDGNGVLTTGWLKNGVIWISSAVVPGGGLQAERALDTQNLRELTLATNADGRLEFLAVDNNGALWSISQVKMGSWDAINIHFLDGTDLQQIAVTNYHNDLRLTVVALGGNRQVFRIEQMGAGNNWGGWADIGGTDIQGLSACADIDGRLEIVATGGDGKLYLYYQRTDGTWSGWQFLTAGTFEGAPAKFVGIPMLVRNGGGRLEVFALSTNGGLYHTYQNGPGAGWLPETAYIGAEAPIDSFSVARLTDGRLALVVAHEGACYCTFLSQAMKDALTFAQLDQQPISPCVIPATVSIASFTANPDYINLGDSSLLKYKLDASNCNPMTFQLTSQVTGMQVMPVYDQGATLPSGAIEVKPTMATTYTLFVQCLNGGASDKKSAQITIAPVQAAGANVRFSNGPFLNPEFPDPEVGISWTVYVTNFGGAASTEFDVIFSVDGNVMSDQNHAPIAGGQAVEVSSTEDFSLDAGSHDLAWSIKQYPAATLFASLLV